MNHKLIEIQKGIDRALPSAEECGASEALVAKIIGSAVFNSKAHGEQLGVALKRVIILVCFSLNVQESLTVRWELNGVGKTFAEIWEEMVTLYKKLSPQAKDQFCMICATYLHANRLRILLENYTPTHDEHPSPNPEGYAPNDPA